MANPTPDPTSTEEPCDEPEEKIPPPQDAHDCDPLPDLPEPPKLPDPPKCEPRCKCPGKPGGSESCLDKLINDQDKLLKEAERAKTFKAALEELLGKAKAAKQAYTRDKHEDFKKRWEKQDQEIAAAIDTVICNVKCWWCVIECEICPLLYKIREIELQLDGPPGALIDPVSSERDLEYWNERNVQYRSRLFDRVKAVLNAWNDPATTIEAALVENDKRIKSIRGLEPTEQIIEVFFKLIPLHLAIAPRPIDTCIDDKYIDLCGKCDEGEPDDCCGPDVGVRSARDQLTALQAYIVDPDKYFGILCCIAENRYLPAKDQLAKAESDLAATQSRIASLTADLASRKAPGALLDAYRANIVSPIDCDKYRKRNGDDCGCDDDTEQTSS